MNESVSAIGIRRLAAVWIFVGLVASATPAFPLGDGKVRQKKAAPEHVDVRGTCATADCHAELVQRPVLHGPTAAGRCVDCHQPSGGDDEHRFRLAADGPELCAYCHGEMEQKPFLHGPVAAGLCTECHDPHGSSHPFMLGEDASGPLCFSCHDPSQIVAGDHVHAPVVAGACVECHDPHTSDYPKMLRREGSDLCFQCHTESRDDFQSRPEWHDPARRDCTECHDPHASDHARQLRADVPDLCFSCHQDVKQQVESDSVVHGAVNDGKLCLNCHDPHSGGHGALLREPLQETCLSCHDQEIDVGGTRPLQNMKQVLDQATSLHGPVVQGDCTACHLPHAGDHFRLLKDEYPPKFYAPFEAWRYGLCFRCHDEDLVRDPKTTTLTGFRDGDENLHYLHVHRERKGRTCRACHETHGSPHPFHIRDSVPFGKWNLPIRYEKLDDGGRCAPGCHQPKEYHRGGG